MGCYGALKPFCFVYSCSWLLGPWWHQSWNWLGTGVGSCGVAGGIGGIGGASSVSTGAGCGTTGSIGGTGGGIIADPGTGTTNGSAKAVGVITGAITGAGRGEGAKEGGLPSLRLQVFSQALFIVLPPRSYLAVINQKVQLFPGF
jgi:hypothetical protein